MKTANLSAVLFSQFVAAEAGNQEALHDQRLCAAYTAIFNSVKHGNHTQLGLVQSACDLYGKDTKESKKARLDAHGQTYTEEGKVRTKGSAVKAAKMFEVYFSYGAAMADLRGQYASGEFAVMKGISAADAEAIAAERAGRFVGVLTATLESFAPVEKTEAEKAAAKTEKEKAAKKAEKEAAAQREKDIADAVAAATGNLRPVTLDDMVAVVAEALRNGTLPAHLHNMIADAAAAYDERNGLIVTEVETVEAVELAA